MPQIICKNNYKVTGEVAKMKIKTVHYSALLNLGDYNNERIGFTVELNEEDSIEEVITRLKEKVQSNASLNANKVRAALYKGKEELQELEQKVIKARRQWEQIAEFLRAQGIKPDAPPMPEFSMLLPEVKDEAEEFEGEYIDPEENEY